VGQIIDFVWTAKNQSKGDFLYYFSTQGWSWSFKAEYTCSSSILLLFWECGFWP